MFLEVPAVRGFDPVAAAQWVVWFKLQPLPGTSTLREVVQRYGLQEMAQTEIARVFRNPSASEWARPPQGVSSLWLAFMLLCIVLGLIVWDFHGGFANEGWPRAHTCRN